MADESILNGVSRGGRARLCAELMDFLAEHYTIDADSEWRDLGGSCNLNVLVRSAGRACVVRVYRPYVTEQRLSELHQAVDVVRGVAPCSDRIRTTRGDDYVLWRGGVVEMENYVPHDGKMDSLDRMMAAMPVLARMHTAWADAGGALLPVFPPVFSNYVSSREAPTLAGEGVRRMRGWAGLSKEELEIADMGQALTERLAALEQPLPTQITHGDFWDNNVLFSGDEVVLVADFDFLGMRPRIDDLALTFYFSTFELAGSMGEAEVRDALARMLRAYAAELRMPLTARECAALPLALARQPLWSLGVWVRLLVKDSAARSHLSDMHEPLTRSLRILDDLEGWREAFRV